MVKTKDGMDIAVVTFNNETEIEFAGASRPLWIISNAGAAIEHRTEDKKSTNSKINPGSYIREIKGNKFAIGGMQNELERKFTNHKLSLNKGDSIYIFSDGFADQFSDLYEKLMISRFKELVISMQNKSMVNQRIFLNNYINRWKGKHVQIDDILVIGVRV